MKRQFTHSTLYVPTLTDTNGLRHIIPRKDSAAYCGATGEQHFPHELVKAREVERARLERARLEKALEVLGAK